MILCAVGDIHGAMNRMYDGILEFECALQVTFDWVLHVGDFGIWPDAKRIDKATLKHDGAGDFPAWLAEHRITPRKTVFIKGNHEDFMWLDAQPNIEISPGLFYLKNGKTFELTGSHETARIGGIGGCFGPSNFERPSKTLQGYSKRHYTRDEIETLCGGEAIDILLTHDAPAGVAFERHRQGPGFVSPAVGLDKPISMLNPQICFFGHHHTRIDATIAGVPCYGLNKVGMPGNMVAIHMTPTARTWSALGEWPRRTHPIGGAPVP